VEPLIKALEDEDDTVRYKAAGALAQLCGKEAKGVLVEAFKNERSGNIRDHIKKY